eukprot:11180266-Lingulodinium_polyedra.AAC.1
MESSQIYRAYRQPVLSGAFGMPKKGVPGFGASRAARFIVNVAPANEYKRGARFVGHSCRLPHLDGS